VSPRIARSAIARRLTWLCTTACPASLLWATQAFAGPPYVTDDPEPVEYRHWELYLASQGTHDRDGWAGTAPHVEVNYGPIPNVQLHVIVPLAYAAPDQGKSAYGIGDTELGIKFRFVHESDWAPQVGTFPFLEVPTGSEASGLGNGSAQIYLPLWLQKSVDKWTTYGGGGYWFDKQQHDRHWWYIGWLVQRELVDSFNLGVEVFHSTPHGPGTQRDTRFNIGSVIDLSEEHHLLFSAGRGFSGPNLFQYYVAYQATLGPRE